ncbi:hypothetical protein ONS95_007306 [Cadophora gregata]|uniref:uncharacterized protein n=1 Tax=Cadophora gregata TaxID=51156 RepID=UPI0026DC40E1|nr:uncharacterized protein ONS95_007306 [Cadophora gregata]KAK0100859.1 hypothetical protein ONS95_007306 [Cadophora gregata]KAK0117148.1 hypothetical protein ONS96_012982 [Cadophora gregata f. sp. sojae]
MEGKSMAVYGDLYKFANTWGYSPLPSPPCQSTVPAVQACVEGVGEGNLGGICSYSCGYGVCPPLACKCLVRGPQVAATPKTSGPGYALPGLDTNLYAELCDFTCSRGYCPPGACTQTNATVVYVDPIVWNPSFGSPVYGPVPAVLVLPPSTLPSPTTIKFPLFVTSLEVGWVSNGKFTGTTTTTTLSIPDVVVSVISFWNVVVTESRPGSVLYPTTSIRHLQSSSQMSIHQVSPHLQLQGLSIHPRTHGLPGQLRLLVKAADIWAISVLMEGALQSCLKHTQHQSPVVRVLQWDNPSLLISGSSTADALILYRLPPR